MSESKERFIEILLAETGVEIGEIEAASERADRPSSARFNYRMAVVIARLNVLQQNRYILAGAQAFEKFTALRKQADKLLETHWKDQDPSKTTNDKWTELRTWMRAIEDLDGQVRQHRQSIDGENGRTPGKAGLEHVRDGLQALALSLPPQIVLILKNLPADSVQEGRLLPELADFATLRQLVYKAGEDIVRRFEMLHALVSRPGSLAEHPLMQSTEQALAQTQALLELHGHHARSLQQAQIEFQSGNIDKARHLLTSLKTVCFSDLQYEQLRKGVSRAARLMNHLRTEKRSEAVAHARTLLKRYPGIHMESQIHHEAMLIIQRGGWWRIVRYAAAALLFLTGVIAFSMHLRKKGDMPPTVRERQVTPADATPVHSSAEVSTTLGKQDDPTD